MSSLCIISISSPYKPMYMGRLKIKTGHFLEINKQTKLDDVNYLKPYTSIFFLNLVWLKSSMYGSVLFH